MTINDLNAYFPHDPELLQHFEAEIAQSITQKPEYRGFIKLLSSLIFLFSDDINNSLDNQKKIDQRILLYSEAYKRIKSSSILAFKGYYVDALSILRSVFELNKGINAVQNCIIPIQDYFGKKRDNSFQTLSDKEKEKLINEHIRDIDNKINNFDDKDVPADIKDSLHTFKLNMHISVHKSFGTLVLNYNDFITKGKGNLFRPHTDITIFELFVNNVSFMMLMFLKNLIKSHFLSTTNYQKIVDLAEFLERSYLEMPEQYHSDVAKYIKLKYS